MNILRKLTNSSNKSNKNTSIRFDYYFYLNEISFSIDKLIEQCNDK